MTKEKLIKLTRLNAVLFARWLAVNYSEVLNTEKGSWYAEKYLYYEKEVLPILTLNNKEVEMWEKLLTTPEDKLEMIIDEELKKIKKELK